MSSKPLAVAFVVVLVATPAFAAGPAFSFDRFGAYELAVSPGEMVALPARLTNHAGAAETFALTGLSTNVSGAWQVYPAFARRVDPGADAMVDGLAAVPGTGGVSILSLRACGHAPSAGCRDVSWRVTTPLVVVTDIAPSFGAVAGVSGSVVVEWLNGAPVAGVPVRITHETVPALTSATETFVTDASGRADFTLAHPLSRTPGDHRVVVQASLPNVPPTTVTEEYSVRLL